MNKTDVPHQLWPGAMMKQEAETKAGNAGWAPAVAAAPSPRRAPRVGARRRQMQARAYALLAPPAGGNILSQNVFIFHYWKTNKAVKFPCVCFAGLVCLSEGRQKGGQRGGQPARLALSLALCPALPKPKLSPMQVLPLCQNVPSSGMVSC